MRVKPTTTTTALVLCVALCAACLAAPARARHRRQTPAQATQTQKPAEQSKQEPNPKQESPPPKQDTQPKQDAGAKQGPPAAKKNARPEAEAGAKPEPFDKATPEEMSKQCVTLSTEEGDIEVEFLPEVAPESVRNFLNLAATGAYDTTTFSRVIKGFVIQGGNLATREKVTAEIARRATRKVPDEPSEVKHVRGVLSMARTDEPGSATTHFFILAADSPHLDGTFAAFGRVRNGMEVVDKINDAELEGETPKKPVRVKRATVGACVPVPD